MQQNVVASVAVAMPVGCPPLDGQVPPVGCCVIAALRPTTAGFAVRFAQPPAGKLTTDVVQVLIV